MKENHRKEGDLMTAFLGEFSDRRGVEEQVWVACGRWWREAGEVVGTRPQRVLVNTQT